MIRWSYAVNQFNPQFAAGLGYQYIRHFDGANPAGTALLIDGAHTHLADMSLIWTPVTNFEVRAEYVYTDIDLRPSTNSGFLRLQRSF